MGLHMEAKRWLMLSLVSIFSPHVFATLSYSGASQSRGTVKSATFRSPTFTLAPGEVRNVYYYGAPFVEGHIGIKSFDAEVVDEDGNSLPLNEVYLHHWLMVNYINSSSTNLRYDRTYDKTVAILGNDGVCPHYSLSQFFGLGSETRHTNTYIPEPYAIEVGNYEKEAWLLNVHAIDTRGTVDPFGCIECRCDLYNVTVGEDGRPLRDGYSGGLECCYDGTHCQLKEGYVGSNRTYYLRYTMQYLDWDDTILPVKIYIFDATYDGTKCKIEYDVPSCASETIGTTECVHTKESVMEIPIGGDVIYGVAHQHKGGIGAAMYGQDGREICTSMPLYGNGTEVGNEAGYIVGMATCYPEPGSVQVFSGESLRMLSNYSESVTHTGVMGLGYIAVYPRAESVV